MFEQFITPINYPALIKMQSMANVTRISPASINGLKANEKAMLKNVKAKTYTKSYPRHK
ncbi:MAG: hypothetical protein IJN90_07065 [Bacilli bacterium]|nr:hypothetical protein [Bacilli bacterium]